MRILHVDSGRTMRGGQWQVLRLMRGLARADVESTLLARPRSPLFSQAASDGLDVRPLGLFALARGSRHVDLVHAHDAHSHTWGALVSTAPLLVSRRVAFPIRSRWKYARPARFLAVSRHVRQVLLDGGVSPQRIAVIYDGVPLGRLAESGHRVIAPATSDPMKGSALVQQAARLAGIPVEFSADLESDLSGAALFVYITRSEGLGSGALLAMAAGVPVLASRVGGLPEIVRHGENGWLTENDPAAIAEAIKTLTADRKLAETLGARGRQTVAERFSVENMVRDTIQLYRQVLAC